MLRTCGVSKIPTVVSVPSTPYSITGSDFKIKLLRKVLKWGEALHDYDVSLAEGCYTVIVHVIMTDPKQVIRYDLPV